MQARLEDLLDHVRGAWRFRTLGVATAWAVAMIGWTVVLLLPNSYEASARVFVNTSTALKPLLEGLAVNEDVDSQLNLVRESLLGRPRLERVAREAELDPRVATAADKDRLVTRLQTEILIDAQAARSTSRDGGRSGDSVYTITYQNPDRSKALTVVRSLLDSLMEDTMSGKREGADSAQKFLTGQIGVYEKRLSEAETRLADFKKRNVGLVPGEQGDYFSRLQNEILAARKVKSSLDVALRRRGELERQLRGEQPFSTGASTLSAVNGLGPPRAAGGAGGNDTASRIAETQAKLDDLLLRFTDRHPDVVALRQTLTELRNRQKEEIEAFKRGDASAAAGSGLNTSPVYQTIQLQFNQTEVEIAALRAELADHERAESELRRVASSAPEVEAEYARLTRDYTVEKAQYNALVERLQKAKLSEDAASTGIVQFQIINPPTSDPRPKSPNRPLLLAVVLGLAIALGAGSAWGMAQLRPVFSTAHAIGEMTGVTVLGTVTESWTEQHSAAARAGLLRLAGSVAGLLIVFTLMLLLQSVGFGELRKLLGA